MKTSASATMHNYRTRWCDREREMCKAMESPEQRACVEELGDPSTCPAFLRSSVRLDI